jgi:hypothetical protein
MYLIRNINISIYATQDALKPALRKAAIPRSAIRNWWIARRSIDARKKHQVCFNYSVIVDSDIEPRQHHDIQPWTPPAPPQLPSISCDDASPFIIGCGPAGLFAALALVKRGYTPILFDRGEPIETRTKAVEAFWRDGILDENSNVQFGEGGAGTFSDGKLTARNRDFFAQQVYEQLVHFGADDSILYEALPHLGTDGLKRIISGIRTYLTEQGCSFHWRSTLQDITVEHNQLTSVIINHQQYAPPALLLAIGNAARDTFGMLARHVAMEAKPFAIGVRIEHPQDYINAAFYGPKTDISITGPATYRLTARTPQASVYSFCMCPGGEVIAGSSQHGGVVTNGMSYLARKGKWANSAIVAAIGPKEFGHELFSGMQMQQMIEAAAFKDEHPYFAPAQSAADFMAGSISTLGTLSYRPGAYAAQLDQLLPTSISSALAAGLHQFDRSNRGFIEQGTLIGPETRTSSPLRILRDRENLHSLSATNLFPIGEGAGYAGGIISSAADGFKAGWCFVDRS